VIDEPRSDGDRHLITGAPLGRAGTVFFVRDLDRDLAVLSGLRRLAGLSIVVALAFALILGGVVAHALGRQVRALASAADRLAAGDFHAPLERPVISEIGRMADAFASMRTSLAARLEELEHVNRELADRQARLSALQSELIQRDRLAAAGQLVAQLAHEIRNPVANVRNCLEVIRRRLKDDVETREFADLAIDELLRMHELAEQMLDLHRPRDVEVHTAHVRAGADEVASLLRVGAPDALEIHVEGASDVVAAIGPDALKQVLLNLARNAREAMRERGRIEFVVDSSDGMATLQVRDTGPGIPTGILPRIFDPFFTTKGAVHGVGLGLFVAEGIVRSNGGRITAASREDGTGARFVIELPLVAADEPAPSEMSG
jgi:signal transduction histidine kinase